MKWLGRLLCWLGNHDWRHGPGPQYPCIRCGRVEEWWVDE
jgi:hypothetical protein